METTLSIRLLGEFSLVYDDVPVTTVNAERLQSLLVYLLLHRHAPQSRQHIAFQLWPDSGDAQSRSNLRNLLFSLRQALPDAERFLEITNLTLQWKPEGPYTLDIAEFERLLAQAAEAERIDATAEERQALEAAVALYGGELLPGNYDDWILPLREELRQRHQEALEWLVTVLEQSGDHRSALRYAQRMLQQDPLDESAYVHLMRLSARVGDRAGVRRIFENCITVLARELDVEPSEATRAAYERYLQAAVPQDLSAAEVVRVVPPQAPALPLPATRPTTAPLPMPAIPFVGREQELAELAQLLADPACRLLTITGPGGIGKTHLALQTAKGHQPVFANGTAFVSLGVVTDADQFVAAVAGSTGYSFFGPIQPWEQLLNFLAEKQLLLVLDNFEHLLGGAESAWANQLLDLLTELLERCPQVKLLITSRERLNLREEWVYDLHGLPLPAENDPDWQEVSSVALFAQMARKAQSTFALGEENRASVLRICQLVEGMPLGLQLAAAWVRVLSPAEIVVEIERNLAFLSVTHRNVPERHRSVQAVFDHSWQLLTSQEQQIFAQLSVFRGSFSREAAEAVTGASLRTLTSLLDKSLVRQSGSGRYSLHELLRHFAAQRLIDLGGADEAAARHGHFYMTFLEARLHLLERMDQVQTLDAIATEMENVQVAWRWAAEHDDAVLVRGVRTFFSFSYRRARFQEGAHAFAYAIDCQWAKPAEQRSLQLLGQLLIRHGMLVHGLGQYDEARASLEVGVQFLRKHGNSPELALGLMGLGRLLDDMGEGLRTEDLLVEALTICKEQNYALGMALTLSHLGHHAARRSRFAQAKRHIEEAVAIYRQIGDVWGLAHALNSLANAAQNPSEYRTSLVLYQESMGLYQRLGNPAGVALAFNNLGFTYMMLGEYAEAACYFEQSLAIQQQIGGTLGIARTLNNQGHVAYLLGNYAEARRLSEESLALRQAANAPLDSGFSLYTLGLIVADMGEMSRAEQYWIDALTIFERFSYQQEIASCLAELAAAALQRQGYTEAQHYLQRSLSICETIDAAWSHARTLMVQGMLARTILTQAEAVGYLRQAFQIATDAHEMTLALDILLELVQTSLAGGSVPWAVDALCLIHHHRQSRLPARQHAADLLCELGVEPKEIPCASQAGADLAAHLAGLAERIEVEWVHWV